MGAEHMVINKALDYPSVVLPGDVVSAHLARADTRHSAIRAVLAEQACRRGEQRLAAARALRSAAAGAWRVRNPTT